VSRVETKLDYDLLDLELNMARILLRCACAATFWCVGGLTMAQDSVAIPHNIVTHNVPALPVSMATRLQRYANTRYAMLYGWHADALLVATRFGNADQLHRVQTPLGHREQLTFLREPLAFAVAPAGGAQDKVVIAWDVGGSEFDQLFLLDLETGDTQLVSDGKSLYAYVVWSPDGQNFAYATTERNGRNWDTHIQSLDGSINRLFETDEGYWYPLSWSPDGKKLLIKKRVSINESAIYELDVASKKLSPLAGHEGGASIDHAAYDGSGGVFFTSDEESEFLRLSYLDRKTGEVSVLTQDIEWNVEGFVLSADYRKIAFAVNEGGVSRLNVWSLPARKPVRLPEVPGGVITSMAFSPAADRLALSLDRATSPSDVYLVHLKKRRFERWTRSEVGGLDTSGFVEPELISYTSFDGRKIPAFVFRPETPGPHPVVIYIHGGPEAQYRPYFSTLTQSYVNEMNVAVIAPNVRGSNGYGKTYLTLDDGRRREDSVKDIGALLDWIDGRTEFDSEKVAVYGGSYGGYMVLASMVHYGKRLAAAVESVGISNFVTFLENTQPYRQDMRRVEYGDERDPEMRRFLQSISPLNHVDEMVTPVLVSQGANDPRVPASESEQIRVALEGAGVPVWYVLAKDEGHGFRKKINQDYDRVAKFAFLEAYLKQE
jgi:dipeptidyl aminopeptidase/acylaminoacyl peptidase